MFYEKLSLLCASKGISVTQFCKEVGLSNSTATKWKKGSVPFHSSLYRISKYFDVEIEYLLDNDYMDYDTWLSEVKGMTRAQIIGSLDELPKTKTAPTEGSGLDEEFMVLARKLSVQQMQRVKDFMRGILA